MKTALVVPVLAASAALMLSACTRTPGEEGGAAAAIAANTHTGGGLQGASAWMPGDPVGEIRRSVDSAIGPATATRTGPGIASLDDRGELLRYSSVRAPRGDATYSFHAVEVSEDHAFAAVGGELHLRAPDGSPIDLVYERHVEHPSGDWSWIGRDANGVDAILTFGEKAMFGVLAAAGGEPLRLTTNAGQIWMVQQNPGVESTLDRAIREGRVGPDYRIPGGLGAEAFAPELLEEGGAIAQAAAGAASAAVGDPTIDVLIGYTPGFVTMMGGVSQVRTRLNHLVAVGNQTFANSQVAANLRLVGSLQVNYTDSGTNDATLDALTGSNGSSSIPVPAALRPLREERERLGADLVTLVRRFDNAEHKGCGVAWLIGGGQSAIVPGHEAYGYSVVSDSNGTLGSDGGHYCRDETLVHEIGHNLGSAHDRDAAMGDDGVLDAEDYGRYAYSFGHKTSAANGNFYTVMAYGDTGQTAYRVFSNPQVTICGGRACGVANTSDNARSLRQTIPLIAAFREGQSQGLRDDFNGDGRSDVLWRHGGNGRNTIWLSGNAGTQQAVSSVFDNAWRIVGTGDFNSDGRADIVWRHRGSGRNLIWHGGSSNALRELVAVPGNVWQIAGVGDFDGDGIDDLLWRHGSTGGNRIWRSANSATRKAIIDVSSAAWQVAGVGDFDGDGRSDILWRHAVNGQNVIWRGGDYASQIPVARVADVAWRVEAVDDFNGDGAADVFWRHAASGNNVVWFGASSSSQQAVTRVSDRQWTVVDSGDFDGDGRADLVWRHLGTGANVIWRSANSATGLEMAAVADRNWQVVP